MSVLSSRFTYRHLIRPLCSLALASLVGLTAVEEIPVATDRVIVNDGQTIIKPRYSTEGVNNVWPEEYEQGYRQRVSELVPKYAGRAGVNTTGEREKYDYPMTVGAWLAGDHDQAIEVLETRDVDAGDHSWTKGIDLYWGFTLKAQMLKFFYLEDQLTPAYRDQMLEAFKIFTASDPRPTLEYALNADSADATVAAFAQEQLANMWRTAEQAREMAESAQSEDHPNKQRFGAYILSILDRWPSQQPQTADEWQAWWSLIAAGDWMIFEEYERRTNPNPHPTFGTGTGPVGATWDPKVRGMRADARNTDNLRGMRECAIYLMAERSGNELIAKLYRDRIRRTALSFWNVGNGEWDSSAYHPHSICAYMNLYAFAQDQEVRKYAKAILDFLHTAGALKYWRGAWSGPNKRDYGNFAPMTSVAEYLWLIFGDTPLSPDEHIADNVWQLVSDYRPPAAAMAFALKDFSKPVTMFNSHPAYSNWLPGESDRPEFFETMYFAHSYNFGTLGKGSRGDVSGFRIVTFDSEQGADVFVGGSGPTKRLHNGTGDDRIGQYDNIAILLAPPTITKKDKKTKEEIVVANTVSISIPNGNSVETTDHATFIHSEKTYLAIIPVNATVMKQTKSRAGSKGNKELQFLSSDSTVTSGAFGFAIEIGEAESHGDFEQFKAAISSKAAVAVADTTATYTASDGKVLAVTYQAGLPSVVRDGNSHDWSQHIDVYRTVQGEGINLQRNSRVLEIKAGGHSFRGELKEDGSYTWEEQLAP